MRSLASFLMRGRMQAVLITVFFAGLSLLLAPLMYISGGAVALVTLRKGSNVGLTTILISVMVMSLLSIIATGSPLPAIMIAAMVWVPVWILAILLQRTVSLSFVVAVACGIGLSLTVLVHLVLGDPVVWWKSVLDQVLTSLGQNEQMDVQFAQFGEQLARLMTAIMVIALTLNVLLSLFVGRWWQATLYNPGGFKEEFHQLRLPKALAWITIAVMLVSIFSQQGAGMLAGNLMIVMVFFFLIQALAIAHNVVATRELSVGWLVGLYLLMVIAPPQIMALLMLVGVSDAWLDIRKRVAPKSTGMQNRDDQSGSE